MKNYFTTLRATRQNVLKAIDGLTIEQLNTIPKGFNNNIAWNLGHLLVTQQRLCYGLSGLDTSVSNDLIIRFRIGSKPETSITAEEIDYFKEGLLTSVDQLATDYEQRIFKNFKPYATSYNVELNSIEDAISFNNVHEALHLGYIMALKRVL